MSKLTDVVPSRVRAVRIEKGWSLAELARRAGTSPQQIMRLESSQRRLTLEWVERLAKAFDMPADELATGNAPRSETRILPVYGTISAGKTAEAMDDPQGEIMVPSSMAGGSRSYVLRADGDSMNKLVPDGGLVIVDPDDLDLHEGGVYAARDASGQTTVKRYRTDPARLEPCSDNPAHQPIVLGREAFSVVGRVLGAYLPLR